MSNDSTQTHTKTTPKSNGNGQAVAFGASVREAVKSEHFENPQVEENETSAANLFKYQTANRWMNRKQGKLRNVFSTISFLRASFVFCSPTLM